MRLIIKSIQQEKYFISVKDNSITIQQVKIILGTKYSFDPQSLYLLFNGLILENSKKLNDYNISDQSVLIMVIKKKEKVKKKNYLLLSLSIISFITSIIIPLLLKTCYVLNYIINTNYIKGKMTENINHYLKNVDLRDLSYSPYTSISCYNFNLNIDELKQNDYFLNISSYSNIGIMINKLDGYLKFNYKVGFLVKEIKIEFNITLDCIIKITLYPFTIKYSSYRYDLESMIINRGLITGAIIECGVNHYEKKIKEILDEYFKKIPEILESYIKNKFKFLK
jgi:hypothetical protein